MVADFGLLAIFNLLDLSSAFNTPCHSTPLSKLSSIGITNTPLAWFHCYLSGHTHFIQPKDFTSQPTTVTSDGPHGSVLGPLLFITYLHPIGNIFEIFHIRFHCCVDDTQLCFSSKPTSNHPSSPLTDCLAKIKSWFSANFLKLNCDKVKALLVLYQINTFQN